MNNSGITLSIETAVRGGSLSILKNVEEICFWIGDKSGTRSEDLLGEISNLLKKCRLKKEDINLIAVSNSVGSHTGLRIGLATALGISKAFSCQIVEVSILSAMVRAADKNGKVLSVISNNNRDIFWQMFENSTDKIRAENQKQQSNYEDFCEIIIKEKPSCIITNESFYKFISEDKKNFPYKFDCLENAGLNLAKYIGLEGNLRRV